MSARLHISPWDIANFLLAALLLVTVVGGPRRLPPEGMLLQTWSMHWELPDGKRRSDDFEVHTFNPRHEFDPFLHEYHWFGSPTMEPPTRPGSNRLMGRFVE